MRPLLLTCIFAFVIIMACGQTAGNTSIIQKEGKTIKERILPPDGYKRVKTSPQSFASYLRNLPLKPHGTKARYYNGIIKPNFWVYNAVVDMDIGERNLQQCADAVMRLRGEYLYAKKQYNKIHFNFTNGFRVDYIEWMKGKRIVVEGNKSYWVNKTLASNTYKDFRKYMDIIFAYAGTISLSSEMKAVSIQNMKIGDVFIQGGSPGHAVIVVDMAVNENGDKVFLLAQSYMPAQDIHILKNTQNKDIGPWYSIHIDKELQTPEWTFNKTDLKRFEE